MLKHHMVVTSEGLAAATCALFCISRRHRVGVGASSYGKHCVQSSVVSAEA